MAMASNDGLTEIEKGKGSSIHTGLRAGDVNIFALLLVVLDLDGRDSAAGLFNRQMSVFFQRFLSIAQ